MNFALQKTITPQIRELIAASDRYLSSLYPPESNHLVDVQGLVADTFEFYLLSDGAACMGCIGVNLKDEHPEIKRLFVKEEFRGRGHGRQLLDFIIARCRELGHDRIRLETGVNQPEALGLFRNMGFREIPPDRKSTRLNSSH